MEHIIQLSKPTLKLPIVEIANADPVVNRKDEFQAGQYSPLVDLAGNYYFGNSVSDFKLTFGSQLLPMVKVTVYDLADNINNDELDGIEVFTVFLRTTNLDFEPICLQFLVTSIKRFNENKYKISGELFIKDFNTELIKSYDGTSFDVMREVAKELGLGFASNVTTSGDDQTWLRLSQSASEFIQEVKRHAWLNDESYVKIFIDAQYHLNYFDVGEAYKSDRSDFERISQVNQMPTVDREREQTVKEFVLTDHKRRAGTDTHISFYTPFDRRGSIEKFVGYERVFKTEDLDENKYYEYSLKQIIVEETLSRSGDNIRNSYTGFSNKNKHRNYDHANVQNDIFEQVYSSKGLDLTVNPINPVLYVGQIVPVMINNNNNLNMDMKGTQGEPFNEILSAYYIVDDIEYIFTKGALSTDFKVLKIRDDIKNLEM